MGQFVGDADAENTDTPEVEAPPEVDSGPSLLDDVQSALDQQAGVEPEVEAAPEPVVETPQSYMLGDVEVPADQVDDVLGLMSWASGLTEEQANAAMAASRGEVVYQQPEPEPEYEEETYEVEYPEAINRLAQTDPETAAIMREVIDGTYAREDELREEMRDQREAFEQLEVATGSDMAERYQAQTIQAEDAAVGRFQETHGELTEQDYQKLVATAGELNLIPGLVQQHGLEDGFYRGLEAAMYANPDFQTRDIQVAVQAQTAENAASARKANAASLATPQAGTNIPAQTPVNLPHNEKRAAMKADIAGLMGLES